MTDAKQDFVQRLSRAEFASALKKGLGRTLIHVTHFGLDDVADLVLEACLQNQNYDAQLEPGRATWLFRMFDGSAQYQEFSQAITNRLKTETETWDLLQLCGLAKEMAAHGDKTARQVLEERILEDARVPSDDSWMAAELWVELEGSKGLLELARLYGQRLLVEPREFVPDQLLSATDNEQALKDVLFQGAQKEPALRAYWDYLEAKGIFDPQPPRIDRQAMRRQSHEQIRKETMLDGILQDAHNKVGEYPSRYTVFGRHATPAELQEIYSRLIVETDNAICLRLLWVFRRAPMPELNERVFHWANGSDEALRQAAIAALAQNTDEQVHILARTKARTGQLLGADREALGLFLNNYTSEDAPHITQALLPLTPGAEDAHSLGYSLLDLTKQEKDSALADALHWVYENTPCSNCRYRAVKQLEVFRRLDAVTLNECEFDAGEEIRDFVQKHRTS